MATPGGRNWLVRVGCPSGIVCQAARGCCCHGPCIRFEQRGLRCRCQVAIGRHARQNRGCKWHRRVGHPCQSCRRFNVLLHDVPGAVMGVTFGHREQSPSERCRHNGRRVAQQGHQLAEARADPWAISPRLVGALRQVARCRVQQGNEQPRVALAGH